MADCHKCGCRLANKRPDGTRKCRHCGFARGLKHLSRSGVVPTKSIQQTEMKEPNHAPVNL